MRVVQTIFQIYSEGGISQEKFSHGKFDFFVEKEPNNIEISQTQRLTYFPPPKTTRRMSCETPAIIPKICQCALSNPFLADRMVYDCQWKVNTKMMEMHEYYEICKEINNVHMTGLSETEEKRLKKLWEKRGWKWIEDENGVIKFLNPDK